MVHLVAVLPLLLSLQSLASPLSLPLNHPFHPSSSLSKTPNHGALHVPRTIPDLEAPDLNIPSSSVGLSLTTPHCNSAGLGVPSLWSDCVKAYNSMEEELTGRVTAYVGNAANNELFSSGYNAETSSMDYIGIPRMYWYGSCIIDIGARHLRQGQHGAIVNSDVAHKNAIKTTAAGILNHCVRRAQGGGFDTAGQYENLRVSVIGVNVISGPALQAMVRARDHGHFGAILYYALNKPPPHVLTTPIPSDPDSPGSSGSDMTTHTASGSDTITAGADTAKPLSSPKLPVTACLREQETKCGLGIECMIEAGAEREDGLMKLLWGAVVEVGSCAWGAGSSIHGRDKVSSEQNST